jgi:hypothetical protein
MAVVAELTRRAVRMFSPLTSGWRISTEMSSSAAMVPITVQASILVSVILGAVVIV